jgi:iron complex outermembrane receptor protein
LVRRKYLPTEIDGGVFSLARRWEGGDVTLGGGVNYYDGNHYGEVLWVKNYTADLAPNFEYYRSKGLKTDANIYLKGHYRPAEGLTLYGDLQYRLIDYRIRGENDTWDWLNDRMQALDVAEAFHFLNPKAGAFYAIHPKHTVFASFGVAHREPNRNNYTDAAFDVLPKAERLFDYEGGYRFRHKNLSTGVNFYYMRYKDQLILTGQVNDIGEPLTSNVPDSYRLGVEWTAAAAIAPWLDWNGHLTWSRNRILQFTEYVDDWETGRLEPGFLGNTPIAYSPDWTAGSLFTAHHKQFTASLQSSYVGQQYLDNTGSAGRQLDAYFVNNLRLGYTFRLPGRASAEWACTVYNLLNEEYESNGYVWYTWYEGSGDQRQRGNDLRYFPQAGIHLMTQLTVRF